MLEKTVLQQLQEIFPMEVNREQADTVVLRQEKGLIK